jgi:hypothetical protein
MQFFFFFLKLRNHIPRKPAIQLLITRVKSSVTQEHKSDPNERKKAEAKRTKAATKSTKQKEPQKQPPARKMPGDTTPSRAASTRGAYLKLPS